MVSNSRCLRPIFLAAGMFLASMEILTAQSAAVRQSGGWKASPSSQARNAAVQRAYFQTQGSLSDSYPPLPARMESAPSGRDGTSSVLPPNPQLPARIENAPSEGHGTSSVLPPRTALPARMENFPAGRHGTNSVPPQDYPLAQDLPARIATEELREIRDARPQSQGAAPREIASGLPFVTPAPRGRYPTSPYQPAVFQTAAYQGPLVSAQLARSGPMYVTAQQSGLPQYQQPGVFYPTAYQCATPAPSIPITGAVPGNFVPPTLPPNLAPGMYSPNNAGYSPIISLGQENYNVLLGRGIIGQPTVYVPGQHVRNFLRYLSP